MSSFALDNLAPQQVLTPDSAEELADCLARASAAGQGVVPWGGGTRQHIGRAPARYAIALCTRQLSRVVEYTPADLVITAEAGITLGTLQAELAAHGQWLPWDPPLPDRATIGGLLASGASGPLRLGYGPPRDWTLGMRVALGDGRLVKSGARVVKNVAGYDTHKLHLGALGTLGVIVEATFKVAPIPEQRRTLLASFTEPRATLNAIEQLRAAPLAPIALVAVNNDAASGVAPLSDFLAGQPLSLVVAARYAGTAGAVARQIREGVRRCVEIGARTIELSEADDAPLWAALADFSAPPDGQALLLRAGAPPAAFVDLMRLLDRIPRERGWRSERMALAGVGLGLARWPTAGLAPAQIAAAVAELRAGLAVVGGYVAVEAAPAHLGDLDIWGPPPETLALMRALRARHDPAGVLNPGRYLI